MKNIPRYIIEKINNNGDSVLITLSDMKYIVELKRAGYIRYTDVSDFDTPVGYKDIAITVIRMIQ